MKTAVIYWSGTGNTEAMAQAIADGAGAELFSVSEFSGNIADYEESLTKYDEGKYAYWLAAGITDTYNQQMIDNVISLFVEENLSES